MSRGKYASSADARQARESAESEVVAGRRKIVQQADRIRELEAALAAERGAHVQDVKRLNGLVSAGVSDELLALRAKVRTHQNALLNLKRNLGREVGRILLRDGAAAVSPGLEAGTLDDLAQLFQLQTGEFFGSGLRRAARRQRQSVTRIANYGQRARP